MERIRLGEGGGVGVDIDMLLATMTGAEGYRESAYDNAWRERGGDSQSLQFKAATAASNAPPPLAPPTLHTRSHSTSPLLTPVLSLLIPG